MARFSGRRRFAAKWTADSQGIKHPSKGQAHWFDGLRALEKLGVIQNLEREPAFEIRIARDCPNCREHGEKVCSIRLDARFTQGGREHLQDYKGIEGDTEVSKLKRRLLRAALGIEAEIVGPAAKRHGNGRTARTSKAYRPPKRKGRPGRSTRTAEGV